MIEEGLVAAAEFPGGVTEPLPQLIASATSTGAFVDYRERKVVSGEGTKAST
jgi:hypothetical protein